MFMHYYLLEVIYVSLMQFFSPLPLLLHCFAACLYVLVCNALFFLLKFFSVQLYTILLFHTACLSFRRKREYFGCEFVFI